MEAEDSGDADQNISAYAKLEFDQFSFFIQTLTLVVGRKAKRDDNVDVHLGTSKSISRVHAKIYYQFDAMSWEVEVLGKNGAFVNERYIAAGQICKLNNTDKLQIAEIGFSFLLPEGAAPPTNPTTNPKNQTTSLGTVVGTANATDATGKISVVASQKSSDLSNMPLAPHHIMQRYTRPPESSISAKVQNGSLPDNLTTVGQESTQSMSKVFANVTATSNVQSGEVPQVTSVAADHTDSTPKKPRKKYTKKDQIKAEDYSDVPNLTDVWPTVVSSSSRSQSPELIIGFPSQIDVKDPVDQPVRTAEEQRIFDEEAAAQHAAQVLHQERLTRQAQEEEEGLILPPPETNPTVIANLQKPTASYATMIYNAIMSHEKKKMTLAQIYSWICIYHPYYRYVQNGWQNSIRHNLSLNKAFKKVPRTDDEPGKGSFWAVDPDSEMLFEGGVYKKKPPRPAPSTPINRGAPVVMKDGKLTLNPNYFAGGIQGKAEEVIQMLHTAVQDHIGSAASPEQVSQLARILALALATQLRLSAVSTSNRAPPVVQTGRPAAQYYSATPVNRVNMASGDIANRSTLPASSPSYSMVPKANGASMTAVVRPAYSGNNLTVKPGTAPVMMNTAASQVTAKVASTSVLPALQSVASRTTNGATSVKASLPTSTITNSGFKRTEVPQPSIQAQVGQQVLSASSPGVPTVPVGPTKPTSQVAQAVPTVGTASNASATPNQLATQITPVLTAASKVPPHVTTPQKPHTVPLVKAEQNTLAKSPFGIPSANTQTTAQKSLTVSQGTSATAAPGVFPTGSRISTGQTILPIPVLVAMGDRKTASTTPSTSTNKRSLDENNSTEANKIQKGKHDETPSSVQRNLAAPQPQLTETKTTI